MENFVYYNGLFDIYSDLLTDNERESFKDYYQEDFSLAEIASENNISRSAVSKTIKNVLTKLDNYEEKLHIYQKNVKLNEALDLSNISEIKEKIEEVLK